MNAAPDLTIATLKMVGALLLVLALLWGLYRWARHSLPAGQVMGRGRLIQVLGSRYLGVKKSISIVQVPGSILVLGITADRINLLDRIVDPSLLEQLGSAVENKKGQSFRDHLQRFTNPLRSKTYSENSADQTERS